MTAGLVRHARSVAIVTVIVAWAVAAHYTSALVDASEWGALLGLAPLVAIAAVFAWRSPRRGAMLALFAAGLGALALAWDELVHNVGWLYFVQHVGTNALLGIGFGRTLLVGREPMCTRLAALVNKGCMSPALARYTRQVTLAWTIFFAVVTTLSVALFAFAPIAWWSVFANLLTMPLVAAMFVAEYALRLRVLAPEDRGSNILDAVRAYWASPEPAAETPVTPIDR